MYGQTVWAEVIVPSGTSIGNQLAKCGKWEILTGIRLTIFRAQFHVASTAMKVHPELLVSGELDDGVSLPDESHGVSLPGESHGVSLGDESQVSSPALPALMSIPPAPRSIPPTLAKISPNSTVPRGHSTAMRPLFSWHIFCNFSSCSFKPATSSSPPKHRLIKHPLLFPRPNSRWCTYATTRCGAIFGVQFVSSEHTQFPFMSQHSPQLCVERPHFM